MNTINNCLNKCKDFLHWLAGRKLNHLFLFPVVFLWDELILRLWGGAPLSWHILYPIVFAVSAGLFCDALTTFFTEKINRRISIALLAVTAFFFTVECLLKNTFLFYFDIFGIVDGTGNVVSNYGTDVLRSIGGGIWIIFLFFAPLLLYLWRGKAQMPAVQRRPRSAAVLLACSLVVGTVCALFAGNLSPTKNLYTGQFDYDTATQAFGLFTSTRLSLMYDLFGNPAAEVLVVQESEPAETDSAGEDNAAKEADTANESDETDAVKAAEETEEIPEIVFNYGYNEMDIDFDALNAETTDETYKSLNEYVSSLEPSSKNDYTGLFKGKNLITITAEAFSSQVINEELTPTLYRLANNGIKFTDFYQPAWGGSTTTGEYSILLGLVPTNGETSMMDTIGDNLYFTTGNQLQRLGYKSLAFHNGSYDYYNRNQTHYNLGYDDFLAWGNGLEDLLPRWSEDPETIEATLPLYVDDQPFNAYYMSYSGHCDYVAGDPKVAEYYDELKAYYGDTYKDTTLYYLCYQMELEHALTTMVDMLEQAGIADDTVIVLCADHYPYGLAKSSTFNNEEDYLLDLYDVDSYDGFVRDKNALIIWSGCIEDMGLEVDTPVYSLDILPTISNLFGLEYDSRLLVGRDVFSDAEPLCLWADHSFLTEKGWYNADTGEFLPTTDEEVTDEYLDEIKTIVANKIAFSTAVPKYDYYGILFGEDDIK